MFVFFGAIVGGLVIGLLFDVFRIWRKNFPVPTALVWVQDALFWLLLAGVVYATIFITNSAQVRWYEFAAIGLGAALYLCTLSRLVIGVSSFVIRLAKRVLLFVLKLVLFPLYLLDKCLRRPILWIWGGIRAVGRYFRRRFRRAGSRAKHGFVRFGRVFRKV